MLENICKFLRFSLGTTLNFLTIIDHNLSNKKNLIHERIDITKQSIAIVATYYEDRRSYIDNLQVEIENRGYQVIRVRNGRSGIISPKEIVRENRGFDLGIFKDVIGKISTEVDPEKEYQILFINDSVEYRENTISKLIDEFEAKDDSKLYSLFESKQRGYHLQSFIFHGKFTGTQVLRLNDALAQFKNWKYKRTAVHWGERSFPRYLMKFGIAYAPLYSLKSLENSFPESSKNLLNSDYFRYNINPTSTYMRDLIYFGINAEKFR